MSLTPHFAQQAIEAQITALPDEARPLAECVGRTLRQEVRAERDNPPFDRVCMDGIAIASATHARGELRYRIEGMQRAGVPPIRLVGDDTAIEVMTGAVLPLGTDCVIPVEEYALADGIVTLGRQVDGGAYRNVQRRGSDGAAGALMLRPGTRLGPPEIAVAASAGLRELRVSRQPVVAVVSTGDELVEPGQPVAAHQIRRSNAYALAAALRTRGLERLVDDHVRDDADELESRLSRHLAASDFLLLSGGVSKGKFDLVPTVLATIGVRQVFHRVAQRPGLPLWFGVGPRGQAVFGLPGNPVSTLVCAVRYVMPAIERAVGAPPRPPQPVVLAAACRANRALSLFLPVKLHSDAAGATRAEPRPTHGSGDFLSLAGTDGFVELPPGADELPAGTGVAFYPW